MNIKRIYELLNAEKACIIRSNECNHQCDKCDLVQDAQELIEMYDILIAMIDSFMNPGKFIEVEKGVFKRDN